MRIHSCPESHRSSSRSMDTWRFDEGEAEVAEADLRRGLGGPLGEGGTMLAPPEDEEVEVGDADPAAIAAFSSSIMFGSSDHN